MKGKFTSHLEAFEQQRILATKCLSACQSAPRAAFNLEGECYCYEDPLQMEYAYANCLLTDAFFEFALEEMTLHVGPDKQTPLFLKLQTDAILTPPTMKNIQELAKGFTFESIGPTDDIWGVGEEQREIIVFIFYPNPDSPQSPTCPAVPMGYPSHPLECSVKHEVDPIQLKPFDGFTVSPETSKLVVGTESRLGQVAMASKSNNMKMRVDSLPPNRVYCVSLQSATKHCRVSEWSKPVMVKTLAGEPPPAPTNVFEQDVTHNSFKVVWTASEGSSTETLPYEVYLSYKQQSTETNGGCNATVKKEKRFSTTALSLVISADGDNRDNGVIDRSYEVYIKYTNAQGLTSEPSETITVRLLELSDALYVDENGEASTRETLGNATKFGQEIILRQGEHNVDHEVRLTNNLGLQLKSEKGSNATLIILNHTRFLYANPEMGYYSPHKIAGFTIVNGFGKDSDYKHGGSMLILNVDHTVELIDLVFKHNRVQGEASGGAVAIARGKGPFLFRGCVFDSNQATGSPFGTGGALAVLDNVVLQLENVVFHNNTGDGDGGALSVSNAFAGVRGKRSSVKVSRSAFSWNAARDGKGGAIVVEESDLEIDDTRVIGNAAKSGGAVSLSRSRLALQRSRFEKNVAEEKGGAIYAGGAAVVATNTNFTENVARTESGGVLLVEYCAVELEAITSKENRALQGDGGAIAATMQSSVLVRSSAWSMDAAPNGRGGSIHIDEGNALDIFDTTFEHCTAHSGGGLSISKTQAPTNVKNSILSECKATGIVGGGGIVTFDSASVTLDCTSFTNNTALAGGGGGILWDFKKSKMTELRASPLNIKACGNLQESDYFVGNKASYGNHVGSGGYVLIQSNGPCQTIQPIFKSSDGLFGLTKTFSTTQTAQEPGKTIGEVGNLYPTFHVLDFYGQLVNSNVDDVLTLEVDAENALLNASTAVSNAARITYGRLLTAPRFTGTLKAAVENGIATFKSLKLMGIPGETYTGSVVSTRVGRVDTTLEVILRTCKPGNMIEAEMEPICQPCQAGKFSTTENAFACDNCPSGTFSGIGASSCTPCNPGTHQSNNGSYNCVACGINTFAALSGSFECSVCEAGQYQKKTGQVGCIPCQAGTFRKDEEKDCVACELGTASASGSRCEGCVHGKYANVRGSSACKSCAAGKYANTPAHKSGDCEICKDGFDSREGSADCSPCKLGSIFGTSRICEYCSAGKYSLIAGEPVQACHRCPEGAVCPGGSRIFPRKGWWLSTGRTSTEHCNYTRTKLPRQCGIDGLVCNETKNSMGEFFNECNVKQRLFKCAIVRPEDGPLEPVCNPRPWTNRSLHDEQCLCNDEECYEGRLCETCAPGFARYGRYECRPCSNPQLTALLFALIVLGLTIFMGLYIRVFMDTVGLSETTSSGVKIVINTLQVASLGAGFPLAWPGAIMDMFSMFGFASSASDQVLQLDCLLPSRSTPLIYQKTMVLAVFPAISLLVCFFLMLLAHTVQTKRAKHMNHTGATAAEYEQFHAERVKRGEEKKQLMDTLTSLEIRLERQHKINVRRDKIHHVASDKMAIQLLRKTLNAASHAGIGIHRSLKQFTDDNRSVVDVRHCVKMIEEWDLGLTEDELHKIRELLDNNGGGAITVAEFAQYHHTFRDKTILAMSIIWYMEFPLVCKTAMTLLGCRGDLEDGDYPSYLRIDCEIPCGDTMHIAMVTCVAIPMILVYALLPLVVLQIILRRAGGNGSLTDLVRFRYGMFTDGFRNDYIWWETVVAFRKALVICISVFLSMYGALLQAYTGVLVIGVFLALQMSTRPYKNETLNELEQYGLGACLVTLYAGFLFFNNDLVFPWATAVTECVVLLVNGAFFIFALLNISLQYAINVSQSARFIRSVIRMKRFFTLCCKVTRTDRENLEKAEKKLECVRQSLFAARTLGRAKRKLLNLKSKVKVTPEHDGVGLQAVVAP